VDPAITFQPQRLSTAVIFHSNGLPWLRPYFLGARIGGFPQDAVADDQGASPAGSGASIIRLQGHSPEYSRHAREPAETAAKSIYYDRNLSYLSQY